MDVTPKYYIVTRVVPISIAGMIFFWGVLLGLFNNVFHFWVFQVILVAFPLFIALAALAYPLAIYQQRKRKIEEQMLLFITRVSVVTVSSVSRKNVFDILKYADEFDELAIEINKIFKLIDNWKISTPEACRMIARQSPSDMFSDFLDRVAIAIENAQDTTDFLNNEHELVLKDYEIKYELMLEKFAFYREVYIVFMAILLFPFVLFTVMPLIVPVSTTFLMMVTVSLFIFVNILMIFGLNNLLLSERIWHDSGIPTKPEKNIRLYMIIGLAGSFVLGLILFLVFPSAYPFLILSIAVIPMFVAGVLIQREQDKVNRRNNVYVPFMSSLGHSTETKGLESTAALNKLRHHDFGDLTKNIDDLYSRLKTRIDSELSWEYFAAETQSELIAKFSKFYVEGAKQGANTKRISNIITSTFTKLKGLRNKREYGSTFFKMFAIVMVTLTTLVGTMALAILDIMLKVMENIDFSEESITRFNSVAILDPSIDTGFMFGALVVIILVNAVGATIIMSISSGGHRGIALKDFAQFMWASYAGFLITDLILLRFVGNML